MTCSGIDKEVLRPLNDVVTMAMSDVRKSPIENLNFAFLSSPTFMEHLYRIVFFTESATSAEETVGSLSCRRICDEWDHAGGRVQETCIERGAQTRKL